MPTLLSSTSLIMMQVVGAGDRVSFARVGNTFVLTSGDWTREALLPARAGRFAPWSQRAEISRRLPGGQEGCGAPGARQAPPLAVTTVATGSRVTRGLGFDEGE